jgi:Sodium:neurotransmitter symporter family
MQVAYFTATFPYAMLTVLVVRGTTLEGASQGILYFFTPNWQELQRPEVSGRRRVIFFPSFAWRTELRFFASLKGISRKVFRGSGKVIANYGRMRRRLYFVAVVGFPYEKEIAGLRRNLRYFLKIPV